MTETMCKCPGCGFEGKWLRTKKFPKFMFGAPFSIWICPIYELARTQPTPALNSNYYELNEEYNDLFIKKQELYLSFAKILFSSFENIIKNPNGLCLLDIGCGGGFSVEYANSLGYISQGLEANSKMAAWCQMRGLNVFNGDAINTEIFNGKKFDVIILSSILEHLEYPLILMQKIKSILSENGIVVISQANYKGLLPWVFPWGWYGWQPKEHYWHFSPEAITRFAHNSGYKIIQLRKDSLYHPWFIKFRNIKEFAGRNIAAAISRIGSYLGMGDCFYIVLRSD